jgi:hypothetical protein
MGFFAGENERSCPPRGETGTARASETPGPASDPGGGNVDLRDPSPLCFTGLPRVSRSPGMHVGHDLLLAVTIAVGLLATLLLYSRTHT